MTIWKFPLVVDDLQIVNAPRGAEPLSVMVQHGIPCLWMIVDEGESERRDYRIHIRGTGHSLHGLGDAKPFGSFMLYDGDFVGHVFAERPTP